VDGEVAREQPGKEWADEAPLVSRFASNPKLRPTIEKFVGRLEEKLEAMQACWEARDFEELARLAHWLKGSAGMVGFDGFGGPAATLELLAKERKEGEIEASICEIRSLAERIVVTSQPDD
jgi:HPt (histidine-containing phosphotransfer) domain-containing protein